MLFGLELCCLRFRGWGSGSTTKLNHLDGPLTLVEPLLIFTLRSIQKITSNTKGRISEVVSARHPRWVCDDTYNSFARAGSTS